MVILKYWRFILYWRGGKYFFFPLTIDYKKYRISSLLIHLLVMDLWYTELLG